MKKFIAVFLCVIMMATMIPSFFASAEDTIVTSGAAAGTTTGTTNNKDTAGLIETISGFIELWGGLLKAILGSDLMEGFGPALKQVLNIFSFGDFFANLGQLWKDIAG